MNASKTTIEQTNQIAQSLREPAVPGRPVIGPACWMAAELAARDDWIFQLSKDEIANLKDMAASVRRRIGDDPNGLLETGSDDFDLGTFAETLKAIMRIIKDGVGVALIRGLPVTEWDRLDLAIAYWGMGRHIGEAQANNPDGHMLGHIADIGKDYDNPQHRGYQTNATMDFHVDQADVVALLTLQTAKSGGQSKIVSSPALYNEMLARRPDLVEVLKEPFYRSRHGEEGTDQLRYFLAPVFSIVKGYLSVAAGYKHILKGYTLPGTPDLTAVQKEALALVAEMSQELHFATYLEPGDIPILNSQVTLHTRDGFEDWPEVERRRHLWRMWLRVDGLRPRSAYFDNWVDGIWTAPGTKKIVLDA